MPYVICCGRGSRKGQHFQEGGLKNEASASFLNSEMRKNCGNASTVEVLGVHDINPRLSVESETGARAHGWRVSFLKESTRETFGSLALAHFIEMVKLGTWIRS